MGRFIHRLPLILALFLLVLAVSWVLAVYVPQFRKSALGVDPATADDDSKEQNDTQTWLKFVPPEFCSALLVSPSRIEKHEEFRKLPFDSFIASQIQQLHGSQQLAEALQVKKVRRVVILADPFPGGNVAFLPAFIFQFNAEIDAERIIHDLWKDLQPGDIGKKTYFFSNSAQIAGAPMAVFIADKRTVLVAPETSLRKMLDGNENGDLRTQLSKADLNHDISFEHSGPALVARVEKVFNVPIQRMVEDPSASEPLKIIIRDVQSIAASLDFQSPTFFTSRIVAPNSDAAKRVAQQVLLGREVLLQQLPQLQFLASQNLPQSVTKPEFEFAKELSDGFQLTTDANQVKIEIARPKSWPDLIKAMSQFQTSPQAVGAK